MESIQYLMQNVPVRTETPEASGHKTETKSQFDEILHSQKQPAAVPEDRQPQKKDEELDVETLQQMAVMQIVGFQPEIVIPVQQNVPECADEIVQCIQNPGVQPEQMADALQQPIAENASKVQPEKIPAEVQQKPSEFPKEEFDEAISQAVKPENAQQIENAIPAMDQNRPVVSETDVRENVPAAKSREAQQDKPNQKEETPEMAEKPVFAKADAVPVKVSETGKTHAAPEIPKPEKQVMGKLEDMLKSGERKVELQLEPKNLGRIKIELVQKDNGELHILLHAEHSEVRSLLENRLPEMQQLIRENTQQNVTVRVPEQEQNREQFENQQQRQGQQNPQQEQRHEPKHREDFLNQLRLGLVPDEQAM